MHNVFVNKVSAIFHLVYAFTCSHLTYSQSNVINVIQCNQCDQCHKMLSMLSWGAVVLGYVRYLAAGGLRVRIHLKPPRRDPGQVLHLQLLMRFGVKLRFSVRSVVGSASE